ncbi:hypothetical protein F5Y10DRAFT_249431 [Nemania abortiva]|nr:hypothetical protein F5Y10DRAFT_249431 [Nemania abortiva]
MSDRWVKENTEAFEVQWKLVEHLLGVWDRVKASKRSKGLGVLEELESSMCIVSLRRDLVDAPIWAFWAFWLAGMRQALEAPTLN